MTTSTTPMTADSVVSMIFESIAIGTKQGVVMFWSIVTDFLIEHWLIVGGIFIGLLILTTFLALMGDWSALGSLLYNTIYFSIIFLIGLIFGPETFLENWFSIFTAVILYPVTYLVVGRILKKVGLKY